MTAVSVTVASRLLPQRERHASRKQSNCRGLSVFFLLFPAAASLYLTVMFYDLSFIWIKLFIALFLPRLGVSGDMFKSIVIIFILTKKKFTVNAFHLKVRMSKM